MANFLITPCNGDPGIVVEPGAFVLTEGNTYYFTFLGATPAGCYTVTSTAVSPGVDTIDTVVNEYDSCFSCLKDNNFSYVVESCDIPGLGGPVNSNLFGQDPLGKYYTLCAEGIFTGCLCFHVTGVTETIFDFPFEVLGPFEDCTCILSANTENIICVPDCEYTGSTSVSPPHPIWINGSGLPVMQMNTVLIGSGNGLNG